jgi:DNA ligase (NAD+)
MKQYLEYNDENSQKFWEVNIKSSTLLVRWGRVGASGQCREKEYSSSEQAVREALKLISSKARKGYKPSGGKLQKWVKEAGGMIVEAENTGTGKKSLNTGAGKDKATSSPKPTRSKNIGNGKIEANSDSPKTSRLLKAKRSKTIDETTTEYLRLVDEVNGHNRLYYQNNAPSISDPEWDQLFRRLLVIERDYPSIKMENSPTDKVGGGIVLDGFEKHVHEVPMLSLDNAFDLQELEEFFERIEGGSDLIYSAEPKMDGFACSLIYENNRLSVAATRGNKVVGENITANVKTIPDIPVFLSGDRIPERLEVRGEIYMDYAVFEEVNRALDAQGKALYKNPRNAASGAIGNLDTSVTRSRKLQFMAYSCHALSEDSDLLPDTHYGRLRFLELHGVPVDSHSRKIGFNEFGEAIAEYTALRPNLPYGIDGIVFKVDAITLHDEIGYTSRTPKWAIAYKYPAEEKETILTNVVWQVGRTGILSPVAHVEPIDLDGALVSRATLHNLEDINRKGLMIGDTIVILRSGDVIPHIKGVNLDLRPITALPIELPEACPSCGGNVAPLPDGQIGHRCTNDISCPAQLSRRIIHFAQKKCMDIEWLGDQAIIEACAKGLVCKPADLFDLTVDQLKVNLTGFKDKKAEKIISSIEKAKSTTTPKFLCSFGIPEVGERLAIKLSRHFESLGAMRTASYDEFLAVEDVGDATAGHLLQFFSERWNDVEELLGKGITLATPPLTKESKVSNLTFVVTGSFTKKYSRKEIEATLKANGAKVSGSVSKNTYAVIHGDKAGSKLDKAKLINEENPISIVLIDEDEATALIDELNQLTDI